MFFFLPFGIRMLKNKAQIAQESINNPESFQGPRRILDPGRKGLRISRL